MIYPVILFLLLVSQVSYTVLTVSNSGTKQLKQPYISHLVNSANVFLAQDAIPPDSIIPTNPVSTEPLASPTPIDSGIPPVSPISQDQSVIPPDNSTNPIPGESPIDQIISEVQQDPVLNDSDTVIVQPVPTDDTENLLGNLNELTQESQNLPVGNNTPPTEIKKRLNDTEVLTSTEEIQTNPEIINQDIIQKSALEEDMLSRASTKEQKGDLLVQLVNEKIDDINNSVGTKDFATLSYINQRLSDQIDVFTNNLQTLSPFKKKQLEQKFKIFSKNAETQLRSGQLVVPEELEQDLEITRGKILSIDNLP